MNRAFTSLVLMAALVAGGIAARHAFAQMQPAGGTASAPSASHQAAAEELLDAMKLRATLDQMVGAMLDQQIAANPQIAPFKQIMTDFMRKYMNFDLLKPDFTRMYCEEFSEGELKEIAAFYRTPTGMKMANKLPVLTQRGAAICQRRVQEHLPELQQSIMEAAKNQQGQQPPAPGR
ncbi:hypothetical protein BH09PLA1_BH09PLA1_04400 [soil metagenome]